MVRGPAPLQLSPKYDRRTRLTQYPRTEFGPDDHVLLDPLLDGDSRFDARTFELGRERFEASPGEWVAVYSPERAVADAMRLRHRVGDPVALRALRAYLSRRYARPGRLAELARELGDAGELLRAMQVVLS